jgi:hypothetical protein
MKNNVNIRTIGIVAALKNIMITTETDLLQIINMKLRNMQSTKVLVHQRNINILTITKKMAKNIIEKEKKIEKIIITGLKQFLLTLISAIILLKI